MLASLIKKWRGYGPSNKFFKKWGERAARKTANNAAKLRDADNTMLGHTLLELLIALPLGLLITLAAISLYRTQRAIFEQTVERERFTEAGWTALHLLATHLRLAGFASPLDQRANHEAIFGCTSGRPISNAAGHACDSDKEKYSDGIEMRYQADTISTWASADGKPTDCLGQAIDASKGAQDSFGATPINYFFTRHSPSTGKWELYCAGNGQLNNAQPIVEGIEQLHIRYQLANTTNFVDAAVLTLEQWSQVAIVQLCAVVLGTSRAPSANYLDCEGRQVASSDGLRRQAFITWVALRNLSI